MTKQPPNIADLNIICDTCKSRVFDNFLFVGEKFFHSNHFLCGKCNGSIGLSSYRYEGDVLVCDSCFAKGRSICSSCKEVITDTELQALGRTYHPDHFVCKVCKIPVMEFKNIDGEPICPKDYDEIFCKYCSCCDSIIKPPDECILALNLHWLGKHFACQLPSCGRRIGASEVFMPYDDLPFCSPEHQADYEDLPDSVKQEKKTTFSLNKQKEEYRKQRQRLYFPNLGGVAPSQAPPSTVVMQAVNVPAAPPPTFSEKLAEEERKINELSQQRESLLKETLTLKEELERQKEAKDRERDEETKRKHRDTIKKIQDEKKKLDDELSKIKANSVGAAPTSGKLPSDFVPRKQHEIHDEQEEARMLKNPPKQALLVSPETLTRHEALWAQLINLQAQKSGN